MILDVHGGHHAFSLQCYANKRQNGKTPGKQALSAPEWRQF
jgi:hypothetical protein